MTLATDYDKLCPIFNWSTKDGGVLFPFTIHPMALDYVDFDGADLSTILGSFVAPFKCRLITAQVMAVNDATGAKSGAATAEPVIGIVYGTNSPLATAAAGTSCGVITCDGAGAVGKMWSGTTDKTTIAEGQEVAIYLKTAAATSSTSTLQDGGGVVTLWFAHANSPA
jgi:hypothetical protein